MTARTSLAASCSSAAQKTTDRECSGDYRRAMVEAKRIIKFLLVASFCLSRNLVMPEYGNWKPSVKKQRRVARQGSSRDELAGTIQAAIGGKRKDA
ncbi:MAG: hypothetical protein KIT48_10865 [Pseudolabrys sp.]|nr:hypothetical protein [Pseudolabrys sp.]